ncbi:MAG: SufD family Fe-S cluster assembly protein [Desulfobacterales bacterium]|nr:SufD family Fe-S cluster assembly protein [Desulfobacterales bacterium]
MDRDQLITALYRSIGEECVRDPDIAHIEIHANQVLGVHLVPGLEVDTKERKEGIRADITVRENTRIEQPVRICFGLLDETGKQKIEMKIRLEEGARAAFLSSCTFPNAVDILHAMDADIVVEKGAEYLYLERHVHGPEGGVTVVPKAKVQLAEEAKFHADFELVKGRVGKIDVEYDAECGKNSVIDMITRIAGRGDDRIDIHEKAHLAGEGAHGVLRTNIAVRDRAHADIRNTLIASAPYARGHVDCREIVQDEAVANAIPIVKVHHPKAHVTHEASIGSVDAKQLETLMSRGLTEDEATDLVIEGLLRPKNR